MRVGIIDYGLGNLKSVAGAVEKVGYEAVITNEKKDLEKVGKLILPGVGAFGDGMKNLRQLGLVDLLNGLVLREKKPILGICLGAQLLSRESDEFGRHQGLGWIDASVQRIESNGTGLRVPHVGWNDLLPVKNSVLLEDIPQGALFYYVHSYHIVCATRDIVVAECEYGVKIAAILQKENIYATQFHPEKSQLYGLRLLKNFLGKG